MKQREVSEFPSGKSKTSNVRGRRTAFRTGGKKKKIDKSFVKSISSIMQSAKIKVLEQN
jgi:hypothetical protein